MEIRNCNPNHVTSAIAIINANEYDGKIYSQQGVRVIRDRKNGKQNVRVALNTTESKVHGSRDSCSGRSGPWCCWHVFEDFARALFKLDPDCTIVTAMATYTKTNFEDTYPDTYYKNAGSIANPVAFGDLCHDC